MGKHWAMGKGTDIYEQRRYEIARDVMAALCARNPGANAEIAADDAVAAADALLAALEESSDA